MLNIRDTFKLYRVLEDHIPDDLPDNAFTYIRRIVESMNKKNAQDDYIQAIMIMHPEMNESKILSMPVDEMWTLFMEGLIDNKIIKLRTFLRSVK